MPAFELNKTNRRKLAEAAKLVEEPAAVLAAAIDAYNEALGGLHALVENIETSWQAVWDSRSQRWQESAAGQVVAETIKQWSDLAIEFGPIEIVLPNIDIQPAIEHRA